MPAPDPDTQIDTVNDRDEAVGTVARGEVLERGRNFRTAHVFVLDGRGDLLLQRLAPKRERHPGRWGSSVAAYLFAGEGYLAGAERRLHEELGLVQAPAPLGKIEIQDERSLKFVSLFLARAAGVEIREPAHIAELRFWPIDEVARKLDLTPGSFTPTFHRLFATFGDQLR